MKKIYAYVAASMFCLGATTVNAETIELTAELSPAEMKYQAAMGGWTFEFNDATDQYTICTVIESDAFTGASADELVGSYSMDQLSPYLSFITNPDFTLWVTFVDAQVVVSGSEQAGLQVLMDIAGDDGNTYKVTASYAKTQATEEKDVDFGQSVTVKEYATDWYVQFKNDDYAINVDILSDELDGTYSANDFDPLYTFADDLVTGERYLYIVDAEMTVETVNGATTFGGWLLLENGVKLNIHAVYGDSSVALEQLSAPQSANGKCWRNGALRIVHQGRVYGVNGVAE